MKSSLILMLGAAMALPQAALSEASPSSESMGRMEGMLSFCAKVDPQSSARYQEAVRVYTRNQSAEAVKAARDSKEYQDAFESINAEFAKVSPDEAAKSCTAFLAGK